MKPEQRLFKNVLKPALDKIPNLKYERIELKTGNSGMPDVMYSLNGTGWIELKISKSKMCIDLKGWSVEQRKWAKDHFKCGSIVYLFVGTPIGNCILLAGTVLALDTVRYGSRKILKIWPGKVHWQELQKILDKPWGCML